MGRKPKSLFRISGLDYDYRTKGDKVTKRLSAHSLSLKTPPASVSTSSLSSFSSRRQSLASDSSRRQSLASDISRKRHHSMKCVFCHDLLMPTFAGDGAVELSCDHMCHRACWGLMVERNLMYCDVCNRPTSELLKPVDTAGLCLDSPSDLPLTPLGQMIPDNLVNPPVAGELYRLRSLDDLPKPARLHHHNCPHPTVEVSEDREVIFRDKEYHLRYLFNVKAPPKPDTSPRPENKPIATEARRLIKHQLGTTTAHWNHQIYTPELLGELLLFDFINISTDSAEWNRVCLYFFENIILMVHDGQLACQIMVKEDISSIHRVNDIIILNLSNEFIPELQLTDPNPHIVSKWQTILTSRINQDHVETTLYQLSTNAWDILGNSIKLPMEVEESSLAAEAEPLPLNLIVSVPVVNTTSLTNDDYKQSITSALHQIKLLLRPGDKMGLIFVGTDGRGKFGRSGKFIGCVEPLWDGWDKAIDEIRVTSNVHHSKTLFDSHFQELQVSLEKCMDLFPFIPRSSRNINKFLIINAGDSGDHPIENHAVQSLRHVIKNMVDRLDISIVRIGMDYNEGIRLVLKLIMSPNQDDSRDITISCSPNVVRYDNFAAFNLELESLIGKLQAVCIPTVCIDVSPFSDVAVVSEVEIGGQMVAVDGLNTISVLVMGLVAGSETSVMLKAKIKTSSDTAVGVLRYTTRWFDEEESKVVSVKIADRGHNDNGQLTPPTVFDEVGYFLGVAPAFSRRQTRYTIIELLRSIKGDMPQQSQEILANALLLVDEVNGDKLELLTAAIAAIQTTLDTNPSYAAVQCEDLVNQYIY